MTKMANRKFKDNDYAIVKFNFRKELCDSPTNCNNQFFLFKIHSYDSIDLNDGTRSLKAYSGTLINHPHLWDNEYYFRASELDHFHFIKIGTKKNE